MRRRELLRLAGAGVLCTPNILRAEAPEPVDVELVLAVDVSRSIDAEEHEMQMRGYAAAFRDPALIRAISGGEVGAVACTLFTWSDADDQREIVPWTRIDGPAAASRFAEAIDAAPRLPGNYTSISGAMLHALELYGTRFEGTRRVLDISGDGPNNAGWRVESVRDRLLEAGVVMNGLAVLDRAPISPVSIPLEEYYRDEVIAGPGAFLVVAEGFDAFEGAVRRKIVREVASLDMPQFAAGPRVERVTA
ncbi:DUF1194 domain-containing protein [Muricoccus radiodurans]|uniref:DUF1194 domain-containing protein n=1 Tax=Muricoccus radiodurans TaxID=2231721 RepID=UPI003CF3C529